MKVLVDKFKETIDNLHDNDIICIDETGFCNIGNAMYGRESSNNLFITEKEKHGLL
jgi:hypothetical protein